MRTRLLRRFPIIVIGLALLLLVAMLATCGGKKSRKTTLPTIGSTTTERPAPGVLIEQSLDDALAELDAFQAPEGIDPGLFDTLKGALRDALVARNTGKFVSAPPGDSSRVTNLDLVDVDGTFALTWHYRNEGDYDQSGSVGIADITPIAMYYGQTVPPDGENTLVGVVDGSGNGVIDIADITPIAMGYMSEVAYYVAEGTQSLLDPWQYVVNVPFDDAVGVGRLRFEAPLFSLDYQTYHITPYNSANEPGVASVDTLSSHSIEVSGSVEWDTGGVVEGAWVTATTSDGSSVGEIAADASGAFTIELAPVVFNIKVSVEAEIVEPTTGLTITNFDTTETIETEGAVDSVLVVLPDPVGTEMTVTGDHAESADGAILLDDLAAEVASVYGRSYDPDEDPDAFPGEFADDTGASLNSSVFLWISGQDGGGEQVDELSSPADLRLEIPQSQWVDLEDIFAGNERIDIPIYDFNYDTGMWEAKADGWLVDEDGFPFAEDMQDEITSGAYGGRIYAAFGISHFSFHNVDYPHIGPWTLSRLPADKRRTKLIYKAFNLAKKIALSQKGKNAYSRVNNAGANLDDELKDGAGPEALYETLAGANGSYSGEREPDPDKKKIEQTQLRLHSGIWDWYTDTTSEAQNNKTVVFMASTLLHETAHWKDDVKKDGGDTDGSDGKHGEEGKQLEKDLFGGDLQIDYETGELYIYDINDNTAAPTVATEAQINAWLDGDSWPKTGSSYSSDRTASQEPSIAITLSTDKSLYYLGEPIPITVEFENISDEDRYVFNQLVLNDYPVTFEVLDASLQPVGFFGPEYDMNMLPDDFAVLTPGGTLQLQNDLLVDPVTSELHFDLYAQGDYTVKAHYYFDATPAVSNTLNITIGPGGVIAGTVYDEDTLDPVGGATIKVSANDRTVGTTITQPDGTYLTGELPVGAVSIAAWVTGYYVARVNDVPSVGGETTPEIDIALMPTDGREWFMFGRDHTHNRRSPVAGPQTPTLRWAFETSGAIEESSPSIGPDGTVFIGSTDHFLYAIYPSGILKWKTELGGSVQSSPTIMGDGTVYVGCEDTLLYAVDSDGVVQWTYDTDGAVNSSPVVGSDGTVYFGSRDQKFYALNSDGSWKWDYQSDGPGTGNEYGSSPAIGIDGTVYTGCDDRTLYAFTPLGALDWRYDSEERIYSSPTIGDDGALYYGTWGLLASSGYVYALDPDGSLRWQYPTGSYDVDTSPAIGADGTVYIGSSEGVFYAINSDGSLKWTYQTDGSIWSNAAVGADGTIYFGDESWYIYALNPDGSLLWSYKTGGRLHRTGPIIAGDGALYVGSGDGYLYKFRDD